MKRIITTGLLAGLLAALPAAAQVKRYTEIKSTPLPQFKVPQPETYTLKNGMRVFLMEDHELPIVAVRAIIRTGSYWEPQNKVGLARLMGVVQRSGGTKTMTGDQMDDYLEARAAFVETGAGGDQSFATMNVLKQDFDDVFKVFVDVLRNPAFAQDKLDLAKVGANSAIARRNDNVGGITNREIGRLVYGAASPLVSLEEYGTIAAITRDDLVAWHKAYYVPNNIMIGVSGDFDSKTMKKSIEAAFGGWPKGTSPALGKIAYQAKNKPGVYFIEKPDVTQANIAMAHLGIEQTNPDYFAAQVMNEILSGGFSGRLMNNIRTKKGLAYGVSGGLGAAFDRPGLMRLGMQTKSASVYDAIAALKDEVRALTVAPPTDLEMTQAKEAILNSFIFNYDSRSGILAQQMNYAYHGLPANYLEMYRSNIEKVSKDDVLRVAKAYVHVDDLSLLIVGRAADFPKPLDTLGNVTKLDITIPKKPGA
ncbi:MAG TPA: pitrilysin family protein [Candidatus Polarisedimenticolaceae bacterium]|nr:pitrilysin family protein [Candidatus Polarisedimenticolaceae bacterium]